MGLAFLWTVTCAGNLQDNCIHGFLEVICCSETVLFHLSVFF